MRKNRGYERECRELICGRRAAAFPSESGAPAGKATHQREEIGVAILETRAVRLQIWVRHPRSASINTSSALRSGTAMLSHRFPDALGDEHRYTRRARQTPQRMDDDVGGMRSGCGDGGADCGGGGLAGGAPLPGAASRMLGAPVALHVARRPPMRSGASRRCGPVNAAQPRPAKHSSPPSDRCFRHGRRRPVRTRRRIHLDEGGRDAIRESGRARCC